MNEAIEQKKEVKRKRGLRFWSSEIETATEEKQQAYLNTLGSNRQETRLK